MDDISSDNAYQASLVTRDRALQARTDAIDVMRRLLDQIEGDPLVIKASENLQKLLDNPEVITDEVFNNIMSKTTEVLDSNFDTQVADTLQYARSKGISGPALQLGLQRAKNNRATAIAGAYRDAIIQRAQSGLTTNLSAINATANLMNTMFQQKRIVSEDLANIMQTVVEEPFQNVGPAALPEAASPAAANYRPVNMDFSQVKNLFDLNKNEAIDPITGQWVDASVAAANQAKLNAQTQARNDAARARDIALTEAGPTESYKKLIEQIRGLQTEQDQSKLAAKAPSEGMVNGIPVAEWMAAQMGGAVPGTSNANPLSPATSPDVSNLITKEMSPFIKAAGDVTQQALAGATSGFSGVGAQLASKLQSPTYIKTQANQPVSILPSTPEATSRGGVEGGINVGGQNIYFGGGDEEAKRAADLAKQGYDVIGTSEGAGVRKLATSADQSQQRAMAQDLALYGPTVAAERAISYAKSAAGSKGTDWMEEAKNIAAAGPASIGAALMKKLLGGK